MGVLGTALGKLVPVEQRRSLDELTDRLDLSVGDATSKRSAFWIMLVLSAIIAISGISGDSTATVIGAMIVAPLSLPILGVGLGLATGRGRLVARSLVLMLSGIVVVILIGFLFAQLLLSPDVVLTNSQVTGRTAPKLMDLTAAMATGLVAAIAVCRKDVGDVMPGVAIAISLVPPLGVVGVCLGSDAPGLAMGALVLFGSNVVAMIITTALVLTASGYAAASAAQELAEPRAPRRRMYLVLGIALIGVLVPMAVNSTSTIWAEEIADAADDWLGDVPGAEVTDVNMQGNTATVSVLSPGELPDVSSLQESVNKLQPWEPKIIVVHTRGEKTTS